MRNSEIPGKREWAPGRKQNLDDQEVLSLLTRMPLTVALGRKDGACPWQGRTMGGLGTERSPLWQLKEKDAQLEA